jgi:hypothetical protein
LAEDVPARGVEGCHRHLGRSVHAHETNRPLHGGMYSRRIRGVHAYQPVRQLLNHGIKRLCPTSSEGKDVSDTCGPALSEEPDKDMVHLFSVVDCCAHRLGEGQPHNPGADPENGRAFST